MNLNEFLRETLSPAELDFLMQLRGADGGPALDKAMSFGGESEGFDGELGAGEFTLNEKVLEAASRLGQAILDHCAAHGKDLSEFDDMRVVMGFDNDVGQLSADELGAYLIGQSMATTANATSSLRGYEWGGQLRNALGLSDDTALATALGQEVWGDNHPENSSAETKGISEDVIANTPTMTMRC